MCQQGKSHGYFIVTSKTFEKVETGFSVNTLVSFPFFVPPTPTPACSNNNVWNQYRLFFRGVKYFPTRGAGWLGSFPLWKSVSCEISYLSSACLIGLSTVNPALNSVSLPGMAYSGFSYSININKSLGLN